MIEKVLKGANLNSMDYNSGNDAALLGTLVPDPESRRPKKP